MAARAVDTPASMSTVDGWPVGMIEFAHEYKIGSDQGSGAHRLDRANDRIVANDGIQDENAQLPERSNTKEKRGENG